MLCRKNSKYDYENHNFEFPLFPAIRDVGCYKDGIKLSRDNV